MSKKPYDFLASEKEPLLYLEASIVCINDGFLTVRSGKEGFKTIAPSGHLLLLLGAGTSITQEAAIFASFHDLQISFARGHCNIHSFFMSGRFQDPLAITNQVRLLDTAKLDTAKKLLKIRLLRNKDSRELIEEAMNLKDLPSLVAWEARWTKQIYREFVQEFQVPRFVRDFDAKDSINSKLNILNNALYSICTAICFSCGLHPSIGFLHGYTRRGGLSFDLADIYKNQTTLPIAFNRKINSNKDCMYALAEKLKENNYKVIKNMISICLALGGQHPDLNLDNISI